MLSIAQFLIALASASLSASGAPSETTAPTHEQMRWTDDASPAAAEDLLCGPACKARCEAELEACLARGDRGCYVTASMCFQHG